MGLKRIAALLLCGLLLCLPAAAAGEDAVKKEEAYLVWTELDRLDERRLAGQISLEEYFEGKAPLDTQLENLGSPFSEETPAEELPARYQRQYSDIQYQQRINQERLAQLEDAYQSHRLAFPAYSSRRLSLERQARELEWERERILWEGKENPDGQGGDAENLLWAARYRVYRAGQEQELLEAIYRTGKMDKNRFTDRRDTLREEEKRAAAALGEAEREAEKYRLRTVVPEKGYNGYWDSEKRLKEIAKQLEKLEERLRAGELGSLEYQQQKKELEEQEQELQKQEHTVYRGYEDDPRLKG